MDDARFRDVSNKVLVWAEERDFRGTDPYDGLNSRPLAPILGRSRFLRLAVTQAVKNSPVNLRPLLGIPPGLNPKGLALFLCGLAGRNRQNREGMAGRLEQMIMSLASRPDGSPAFSRDRALRSDISLEEAAAAGIFAWGYDFPWQGKAFLQPAWAPTVVCSSFVLDALRDSESPFFPVAAERLADFVEGHLRMFREQGGVCFSYSPRDGSRVYNASLFAAKILARAAVLPGSDPVGRRRKIALEACRYVAEKQLPDGGWHYGEAPHWRWTDGLHTGFVLDALRDVSTVLDTREFSPVLERGLRYYLDRLFLKDGTARYYSHSTYPLDPHCFAQGAVTLCGFGMRGQARMVLSRAVELLWDPAAGGFIFRRGRHLRNRAVHIRWNQAWMFKALSLFLAPGEEDAGESVV
jgi:hypothetical protein